MFLIVVAVLFVISFLWALFSLRKELSKPKEVSFVKDELMKEKVLFVKD
jgi:Na+/melibiose symporter-like transporter